MTARLRGKPQLTYRDRMDRHNDAFWLVWSNKRGCWYRPKSASYTSDIAQAGIYTKDEARLHYDGPATPKKYRDTEPFPISSVRRQIDVCEREAEAAHAEQRASIARLRAALAAPAIQSEVLP